MSVHALAHSASLKTSGMFHSSKGKTRKQVILNYSQCCLSLRSTHPVISLPQGNFFLDPKASTEVLVLLDLMHLVQYGERGANMTFCWAAQADHSGGARGTEKGCVVLQSPQLVTLQPLESGLLLWG